MPSVPIGQLSFTPYRHAGLQCAETRSSPYDAAAPTFARSVSIDAAGGNLQPDSNQPWAARTSGYLAPWARGSAEPLPIVQAGPGSLPVLPAGWSSMAHHPAQSAADAFLQGLHTPSRSVLPYDVAQPASPFAAIAAFEYPNTPSQMAGLAAGHFRNT